MSVIRDCNAQIIKPQYTEPKTHRNCEFRNSIPSSFISIGSYSFNSCFGSHTTKQKTTPQKKRTLVLYSVLKSNACEKILQQLNTLTLEEKKLGPPGKNLRKPRRKTGVSRVCAALRKPGRRMDVNYRNLIEFHFSVLFQNFHFILSFLTARTNFNYVSRVKKKLFDALECSYLISIFYLLLAISNFSYCYAINTRLKSTEI